MKASLFSAIFVLSALCWSVATWLGLPVAGDSRAVVAADLMILTAVAVVGMLIGHARWARRLAIDLIGGCLILGVWLEVDGWWIGGAATSCVALIGLAGSGFQGVVRKLPAAAGPPTEAVLLPLVLTGTPALIALTHPSGLGVVGWVGVAGSIVTGFWYVKTAPGAVMAVRVLAPAILAVTGLGSLPWGVSTLVVAVVVARLAWSANARVAARPLVGGSNPLPVELSRSPK